MSAAASSDLPIPQGFCNGSGASDDLERSTWGRHAEKIWGKPGLRTGFMLVKLPTMWCPMAQCTAK